MKTVIASTLAIALAAIAAPLAAQDVGATVTGNDGNPVGTVIANDGTTVTVDTGTHRVPLGPDSFAMGADGPTLNTTKAELDATFGALEAERRAALDAALVAGAPVVTADAQPLGTVEPIEGEAVVIARSEGTLRLGREVFAPLPFAQQVFG